MLLREINIEINFKIKHKKRPLTNFYEGTIINPSLEDEEELLFELKRKISKEDKKFLREIKKDPNIAISITIWNYFKTVQQKKVGTCKLTTSDLDNQIKLILDSMNGIFWKDDRQVSDLEAHKRWDSYDHSKITIKYYK